jgi:hypothetical protein
MDMEGNRYGPVEVVSRDLPGRTGGDRDRTVRTAGVPAEIRTGHLHYTSPRSYRYSTLVQKKIFFFDMAFIEAEILQNFRRIILTNKSCEFSTE